MLSSAWRYRNGSESASGAPASAVTAPAAASAAAAAGALDDESDMACEGRDRLSTRSTHKLARGVSVLAQFIPGAGSVSHPGLCELLRDREVRDQWHSNVCMRGKSACSRSARSAQSWGGRLAPVYPVAATASGRLTQRPKTATHSLEFAPLHVRSVAAEESREGRHAE